MTAAQQYALDAAREGKLFRDATGKFYATTFGYPVRVRPQPIRVLEEAGLIEWVQYGNQKKAVAREGQPPVVDTVAFRCGTCGFRFSVDAMEALAIAGGAFCPHCGRDEVAGV